jgi:AcrR family transcriptional regulator
MDPRVARSREAVLAAAAELLIEGGYALLTIDGISRRSGVARTTIYRHWDSLPGLLLDIGDHTAGVHLPPATDDPVADLRALLQSLAHALEDSEWGKLLPSLVDAAARDPEVREQKREFVARRRDHARSILARLVEVGRIDAGRDLSLLVDQLVGPLFYRRLLAHLPIDDEYVDALVDATLDA